MPPDCALADREPLAAVMSTGWPHAEVLTLMKIAPLLWEPAPIAECWQVAPVEVA
jgi:hypothetical protein